MELHRYKPNQVGAGLFLCKRKGIAEIEVGYRLHTVLSSDKVSKSISFDGNVSPQTTMIFEKL